MKSSRLWLILSALLVGTMIGTMGNSMVSIALPSLMGSFSIPLSIATWSLTLYTLTFSVFIPIFGSLSNAIGYKRLFIGGMLLVFFSSILCVAAPNFAWFVIARFFLGVGVASVLPSIMGFVKKFPQNIQGKATGIWSMVNSLGHAFGPTLGGFLIGFFGWPYIFWINLPLALISIVMAYIVFPSDESVRIKNFDWLGAIGITILVFSAMIGITQIAREGLFSREALPLFIVAVVTAIFLVIIERKQISPFVDQTLFRNPSYASSIVSITLQAFSQFGLLVSLPVLLIDIKGIQDQYAGLIIMSMTLLMAVVSSIAGRMSDRMGSMRISFWGAVFVALGASVGISVQFISQSTMYWMFFILSLLLFGMGFGMIQSSSTLTAIQSSPKEKTGAATGFFHMLRFVSASIGSTLFSLAIEFNPGGMLRGYYSTFVLVIIFSLTVIFFTVKKNGWNWVGSPG